MLFFKSLFAAPRLYSYTGPTVPTAIAHQSTLAANGKRMSEVGIFANGCFWGTEHMFRKAFEGKGVESFAVGYIGGSTDSPSYKAVCTGQTGHAEALKVVFDPSKVSYAELTEYHFRMHDCTQVDRQGPDRGTQYRSGIFTTTPEQEVTAKKVMAEVQAKHYPNTKIATIIQPAGQWYDAEDYHQKYLHNNPNGYEFSWPLASGMAVEYQFMQSYLR